MGIIDIVPPPLRMDIVRLPRLPLGLLERKEDIFLSYSNNSLVKGGYTSVTTTGIYTRYSRPMPVKVRLHHPFP